MSLIRLLFPHSRRFYFIFFTIVFFPLLYHVAPTWNMVVECQTLSYLLPRLCHAGKCLSVFNMCFIRCVFPRQAPHPYMDAYCTCHHFISRHEATRKPAAPSVSPLIYLFIYLLIDLCSFPTSWDSSAAFPCRIESSLGFDILRNVPRHFFERHSSSVRIANSVAVSRIESRKARMKKSCIHLAGGTF